jgi:hypothetical protein
MAFAFATKWHFLAATVLIGVDRTSGVFTGTSGEHGDLVCVWSTEQGYRDAVDHQRFEVRDMAVSALLRMLPTTVGVLVDAGSEDSMRFDPAYVRMLVPLLVPFPAGTRVRCGQWSDLPAVIGDRIRAAMPALPFVRAVHALVYTVDDSPALGALVYDVAGPPAEQQAAATEIARSLDGVTMPQLHVVAAKILGSLDLPEELRAQLPVESVVYARR